jgi:hypothetical protein
MFGVPAGDHVCDHFVNRKPVHLRGTGAGVAGQPALRAEKPGQIAAADTGGKEAQQNLAFAKAFRELVGQLGSFERVRRD